MRIFNEPGVSVLSRSITGIVALGALSYIMGCGPAGSGGTPVALHLRTDPPLPEVGRRVPEYEARVGMRIQVLAEIEAEDGTRRDVTHDPETVFVSTHDKTATVTETGEVTFHSIGGRPVRSVGIMVAYGELGEVLNFRVEEATDTNRAQP